MTIDPERIRACLEVLEEARGLAADDPDLIRLEQGSAHLRKTAKKKRKVLRKQRSIVHDARVLSTTVLGASAATSDESATTAASDIGDTLKRSHSCYRCKAAYNKVHAHYHSMCRPCGDLCFAKRDQRADLSGRRALVTGGRTKIGYATALKMLRDGATVVVTTRFPRAAADRYLAEPDCETWQQRLQIVAVDFRRIPAFLEQVAEWKRGAPFDILVNNAAQTVWHPPAYYRGLWAREAQDFLGPAWILGDGDGSDGGNGSDGSDGSDNVHQPTADVRAVALSSELFPSDRLDSFGNPVDLRRQNSWVQHLGEINAVEMLEVQMVNNIAPFILCNELISNMEQSAFKRRFIVNVTAVEGQFEREKSTRHPHTNMAKAALNMLTRTCAEDCEKRGIYMVAVDPGWMSHETPNHDEQPRITPLQAADSAARIYDPIIQGLDGVPLSGQLLKDFRQVPW